MKKWFLFYLFVIPILVFAHEDLITSASTKKKIKSLRDCGLSSSPMRFSLRHIEGNGIGYNQGYSTAELFFSSPYSVDHRPFIDLRAHVFNNGKCAFNAGGGYRVRFARRIYGCNLYYDWRNTSLVKYNQIGLGLETLGITWDFRVNGYVPVGSTKSYWYHPLFGKFEGNQLYIKRKREFAMYGVNAEAAGRFPVGLGFEMIPALGPYYFTNQGKNAVGGQFRLMAKYKDYVSLEGSVSYDTVFRDIYQGQLAIHFPFGKRREVKRDKHCKMTCTDALAFNQIFTQPVIRDEIIVVDKRDKNFLAIDPATGMPWNFLFVNNTSHSRGTFESPFNTLDAAIAASKIYDVLYIYPGDGSITGLNSGYTLLDNQQLLGAGIGQNIATQFGVIGIPPQATGMPTLTAPGGSSVITVGNNNVISGLHFVCNGATAAANAYPYCIGTPGDISAFPPIVSVTTNNLTVMNSVLDCFQNAYGIAPNNQLGEVIITNNIINSSDGSATAGIVLFQTNGVANNLIADNQIHTFNGTGSLFQQATGLVMSPIGTSSVFSRVSNNVISYSAANLQFHISGTAACTAIFEGNIISDVNDSITSNLPNASLDVIDGATCNLSFVANTISNTSYGKGLTISCVGSSNSVSPTLTALIEGNSIVNNQINNLAAASFDISASNTMAFLPANVKVSIKSNFFNNPTPSIIQVANSSTMCLSYTDNFAANVTQLNQTGSSTFNLEPLEGNTGTITQSGVIVNVPKNFCESP